MRCVTFDKPGNPDVLQLSHDQIPVPQADQVLIKVSAAGVNRPDILQRQGLYQVPKEASPLLGLEVAGEVIACGADVEQWQVGDKVCALVPGGGYAEYCVAFASHCLPIPKSLSLEEAAALPETFFTVWYNLFQLGKLQAGDTVLIHGGASGIGTTAIQLAKHWQAKVIATTRQDWKKEACLRLGADLVINSLQEDVVKLSHAFTQGKGVQLILDILGGRFFKDNLSLLAQDGKLLQIAYLCGKQAELDLSRLLTHNLTIMGSTLRSLSVATKASIAAELTQYVWPLLEQGKIKPIVAEVMAVAEVAKAHQLIENNQIAGKLVLRF